jgi:Fe-S cluster assembly iron-binding protein IscA
MLNVTDNAKKRLREQLENYTDDSEVGARLVIRSSDQLGLVTDKEKPGDQVVEYEGLKVLLLGKEAAPRVDGKTLDLQDTVSGQKLVIR